MVLTAIAHLIINAVGALLTPIGIVHTYYGNVLEDTKLINLIRLSSFFFSSELMTFCIDTFVMWFAFFLIRPLVNFIRNKS